jgi:phenylpyruvate tautomerase
MRHLLVLALLACASSRANALRLSLTVHPARSSSRTSGTSLIASADAVDPSLVLNTNVVLSDKKRFLKAASAAIAAAFSKPEQYVAVCVTDKLDLLFGGSDAPCAIGCVYSIGEINQKNNAALTAAIADLLFAYGGIHDDRIYLNFFDVPPANCDCDCLEPSAASSSCCSSKLPHPSLVQSQVAGPGAHLQTSPTDAIPTSSTHQGMRTSRVLIGVTASFECDDLRASDGSAEAP